MSWEETFRSWAKAPSATEQERCENAEKAICEALNSSTALASKNILVFAQGSYKNNMYVRLDSDVDINVMLKDTVFVDYPEGHTDERYGLSDSDFTYAEFKNLVEKALIDHFGSKQVTRGNKAFDIHANSYRVDADVVPTFEYRLYTGTTVDSNHHYHKGTKFFPDDGGAIINWPNQTHENGIEKNSNTNRRYKAVVRIIKNLRGKMQDAGIKEAEGIESFLIASLVWNVPNSYFGNTNYYDDVREVLAHTFNATLQQDKCNEWGEVNELKYLFRDDLQPWTRQQAHNFLSATWDYVGFK